MFAQSTVPWPARQHGSTLHTSADNDKHLLLCRSGRATAHPLRDIDAERNSEETTENKKQKKTTKTMLKTFKKFKQTLKANILSNSGWYNIDIIQT